jgi:peptidoglycan-associated lipoprotein
MRVKIFGLMAALVLAAGCTDQATTETETETAAQPETTSAPPPPPPEPPKMSAQEDLVINVGDRVFFDFDKSDLRPDAIETLNRQADWMKANASVTVAIEGHCDERGTREYNLALGERRAASAKQYLESMGVDGGRMGTVSYGKERPAVLGSNEAAWAQNRRAVTVVKSGELS